MPTYFLDYICIYLGILHAYLTIRLFLIIICNIYFIKDNFFTFVSLVIQNILLFIS